MHLYLHSVYIYRMDTTYLCGKAGCLAEGVALAAAILVLVLIGWIYVTWQDWAVRSLEKSEQDLRRERCLKAIDQNEGAHGSKDDEAA